MQKSTIVDHRNRSVRVEDRQAVRQALQQLKLQSWIREAVEDKRRRLFVTRR